MTKVLVTESHLADIANAIRYKLDGSDTYRPGDMAAAIASIESGYPEPTGTLPVTANGIVNVKDYASANVNVQPNLQSKTATQNGTVTPDSGYDGLSSVVVNVQGGGSTAAFLRALYMPGHTISATDGTTTLTGDDSGDYIFSLPNTGTWTLTSGSETKTVTISDYGTSSTVSMLAIVSLVPVLSSLTGSNGQVIYNGDVPYNWSSAGDVWKAFDGNTSSYGQYKSENQSGFWVGYQFNSDVYVDNFEFYGSNYANSDDFDCVVEIMKNGVWTQVGTFKQSGRDTTVKTVRIAEITDAVRVRSETLKTSGHNWFIREIVINGVELT